MAGDKGSGGLSLVLAWIECGILLVVWYIMAIRIRSALPGPPLHSLIPLAAAFGLTGVSATHLILDEGRDSPTRRAPSLLTPLFSLWMRLWPPRRFVLDLLAVAVLVAALAGMIFRLNEDVRFAATFVIIFLMLFFLLFLFSRVSGPGEQSGLKFFFLGCGICGLVVFLGLVAASAEAAVAWRSVAGLAAILLMQATRLRALVARTGTEAASASPPEGPDRYRLTVERKGRKAPAPPPEELVDDEGASFVGSGSFSVDAAKMVEKLREHQLADPHDCLLPWLRCAVASGATRIELERIPRGLQMRFDGRPFAARELARPYRALLEEDADGPRGRHFAYGLLALQRLDPRSVRVVSDGPAGRAEMSLLRHDVRREDSVMEADGGTLIRVRWDWWAAWWRRWRLLIRARTHWGLAEPALLINHSPVPVLPPRGASRWPAFKESGWLGIWLRLSSDEVSVVHYYHLGVFVEAQTHRMGDFAVEAYLASDDLTLNISQDRIVRDARFENGMEILRRKARATS
ncbi:MAG: hypothetical protein ABII00_09975 [Elusimicrobiota bacterium]